MLDQRDTRLCKNKKIDGHMKVRTKQGKKEKSSHVSNI
jgi:hypothetical protein